MLFLSTLSLAAVLGTSMVSADRTITTTNLCPYTIYPAMLVNTTGALQKRRYTYMRLTGTQTCRFPQASLISPLVGLSTLTEARRLSKFLKGGMVVFGVVVTATSILICLRLALLVAAVSVSSSQSACLDVAHVSYRWRLHL